ncbi:PDZ domain-containing protein [Chloroflexi bacterium TSY]|nr:PDZ domain-containing protein [Chloroflexi bacterium TSY]
MSEGILLVQLYQNSPLRRAGVEGFQREAIIGNRRFYVGGDILIAIDGTMLRQLEDLEPFLQDHYQVGDEVTVRLIRNGQQYDVRIKLVEEPE